jgi:MauM/NapG family ferredoxin protein
MRPLARWLRQFVRPVKQERLDVNRRSLLAAGLAGAGAALLLRVEPLAGGRSYAPGLIRPPGALPEHEFLERCVRCGECMKVCPTNAIHPVFSQAGTESMWTPYLDMDLGYCDYECTLCGQVCPTDAIRELTAPEKQKVRIGLAYFDRSRCLPYAYARSCIVCEEHCPTPKKAIWFEEVEVTNHRGERLVLKQPRVDAELCTGCGICQNKCPMADRAAVLVTSLGESRNPANQILLTSDPYAGGGY